MGGDEPYDLAFTPRSLSMVAEAGVTAHDAKVQFLRNVNKALLIPLSTPYDTSNAAGGGEHFSVRKRDAQNSETGT